MPCNVYKSILAIYLILAGCITFTFAKVDLDVDVTILQHNLYINHIKEEFNDTYIVHVSSSV